MTIEEQRKNVKVGECILMPIVVRYSWTGKLFYIAKKIVKESKTQFTLENKMRVRKSDFMLIKPQHSASLTHTDCHLIDEERRWQNTESEKVFFHDQSAEMIEFKELLCISAYVEKFNFTITTDCKIEDARKLKNTVDEMRKQFQDIKGIELIHDI